MGFHNKIKCILFFIILNACLFELKGQENKTIDLDYLYSDWAFSHNESFGDICILRRSTDEDFLSIEERKDWYDFEKRHDSVLYNAKIYQKRGFVCLVGYNDTINEENEGWGLYNLWTFDSAKFTLSHTLYGLFGDEKQLPIFTSIYKISEIRENYIRLHLQKELFEGVEIEE